jgi:hypothetical protein
MRVLLPVVFYNFLFIFGRVFSNFESLVELHLTNAFADNSSEELAADLHDIFINSDLTKLRKLHLEQNEISHFKDPRLFCELNDLMDLHLSKLLILLDA